MRWRFAETWSLAVAVAACGGEDSGSGTSAGSEGDSLPGVETLAMSSAMSSDAEGSEGESVGSSGGEEAGALCDALDVSLVVDPDVARFDAYLLPGLLDYFDTLVASTGARVRVLANVGSESVYSSACFELAGNAAADPVLVWGEGHELAPGAADALACWLEEIQNYSSGLDEGDGMFAGVMFPVLLVDDWPAPEAVVMPMLFARNDNTNYGFGGMYNRPGIASEAYLRLAAAGDRRRAAAFTMTLGDEGDLIETFGVSLSPFSRHYRRTEQTAPEALVEFGPIAAAACDAHDETPSLEVDYECERIDILFVIDGSGSMMDEQAALQGEDGNPPVFAEFTDALVADLVDVEDFHVGVISAQPDDITLHTHSGAPLDFPSPETDCGLPQPWIGGPSATLAEDFACLAATRSDMVEVPARNAVEALQSELNAGFLRDDSLLIVVILTDEDEQTAVLDNMDIHRGLLDAVGGELDRLLLLSIAGDPGIYEMPLTICEGPYGHAAPGRRLTTIARSLRERGFTQGICDGDMASTFEELLGSVISICTLEP
jgi:hypothetical protein